MGTQLETDDCCYVVYEIFCDGRLLKRDGAVVLAEVVGREDWLGPPSFLRGPDT